VECLTIQSFWHSQERPPYFEIVCGGGIEEDFDRALVCDSEISLNPLPGERILLGGRICDRFMNYSVISFSCYGRHYVHNNDR
jgi:hypothetical protein